MIYFSQIQGSSIFDDRQNFIAKVKDIVVAHQAGLTYPVVKGITIYLENKILFISYADIEILSPKEITLNKTNCWEPLKETDGDILLGRGLMDKQIFDIDKIRVVRVNDLQLAKMNDHFGLVAVDVSFRGLLRRLGLPLITATKLLKPQLIDWGSIDFVKESEGELKLKTSYDKLTKLHPADIANLLENMSLQQGSKVIQSLDSATAADVLAEVEPKYKDILLENLDEGNLREMLDKMPTDEAADIIQDLSIHKKDKVLENMESAKAHILSRLIDYEDDAGSLMTTDYFSIDENATIFDTIKEIRKKSKGHRAIYHIFVKDGENRLKGVASIRTLLLADKDEPIKKVMSRVIATVNAHTSIEEVARLLTKYNLLSIVVVDEEKKIHGIVTVDDVMRVLIPHA